LGREHVKPEEIKEKGERRKEEEVDSRQHVPNSEAYSGLTVDIPPLSPPSGGEFKGGVESEVGKPIILLVEDNADLRSYIRSYLDQSYSIIEAEDGNKGLELATEHLPDLIISDVMMPELDGIEMCKRIKMDIRTSHIPLILLTAKASINDKIEGLDTGADDYLIKPFNPQELIIRVHNMIERQNKVREHFIKEMGLDMAQILASEIKVSSIDEQFLVRARLAVEENMSDPDFNVDLFGKLVNMSRTQVYRKLMALVNLPPSSFIRTIRLNRAASLIKQKSGNISEIAYSVGFNNLSYFTRCFQEYFGVLPSEFKDDKI
jgi:DNA-binding response OmpR family regulator